MKYEGMKEPLCTETVFSDTTSIKKVVVQQQYKSDNHDFCGIRALKDIENKKENGTPSMMMILMIFLLFIMI